MPKVSVVMPSLNVGSYIRECMESVANQTLKDIEIIAVDAGSSDGTLEILQEYEKRDGRIQVVCSEKKSYGYQVNLGIALAQGEYIGILETDDYIVPDMYETLYEACVKNDLDFAKGYTNQFYTIKQEEKILSPSNAFFIKEGLANQVINPSERPDIFLKDRFLWLGLYKSEVVKTIKLNETPGAAFQDVGFQLQLLSRAKRACYIDKPIHFYRQDNSQSSIHNTKSVGYIVQEYQGNKRYLEGKVREWYTVFYTRMFDQLNSRFQVMARGERYWSEAISDIDWIIKELHEAVSEGYLSEATVDTERWQKLQLLFQNKEAIYEEYLKTYTATKAEFRALLEKVGNYPLVIFGAGKHGAFLQKLLRKRQIEAVAFCDNNSDLHNIVQNSIPVLSVVCATKEHSDAIFVIANAKHFKTMKQQLLQQGIAEERIAGYFLGESALLLASI